MQATLSATAAFRLEASGPTLPRHSSSHSRNSPYSPLREVGSEPSQRHPHRPARHRRLLSPLRMEPVPLDRSTLFPRPRFPWIRALIRALELESTPASDRALHPAAAILQPGPHPSHFRPSPAVLSLQPDRPSAPHPARTPVERCFLSVEVQFVPASVAGRCVSALPEPMRRHSPSVFAQVVAGSRALPRDPPHRESVFYSSRSSSHGCRNQYLNE